MTLNCTPATPPDLTGFHFVASEVLGNPGWESRLLPGLALSPVMVRMPPTGEDGLRLDFGNVVAVVDGDMGDLHFPYLRVEWWERTDWPGGAASTGPGLVLLREDGTTLEAT